MPDVAPDLGEAGEPDLDLTVAPDLSLGVDVTILPYLRFSLRFCLAADLCFEDNPGDSFADLDVEGESFAELVLLLDWPLEWFFE